MSVPRTLKELQSIWHPIASSSDLPFRHVYHGQVAGRELAVWRADDGFVNAWENRCLHRGVRLSIGINDGAELKCQYHGWRYSNRSAACVYIPAHPADSPSRTICNRVFPVREKYGLVWSGEQPEGEPSAVGALDEGTPFPLRPVPVDAPFAVVLEHLGRHDFRPTAALDAPVADMLIRTDGPLTRTLTATAAGHVSTVVLFVQPVDSDRSVIRGVLSEVPGQNHRIDALRHHNWRLEELRNRCERVAAGLPKPERFEPIFHSVPKDLAAMPAPSPIGRTASGRAKVVRKWTEAVDIAGLELESISGQLPPFQPGAHIDIHLPNGLVRQYSLTNGPDEVDAYRIGIKRDPESSGGSSFLHDTVREDDLLAISEPRNNFPLRRDAVRTILIAGGIGVTPLLSMARTLDRSGLDFEFHYFARDRSHLAFTDILSALSRGFRPHLGLDPARTKAALEDILSGYRRAFHMYVCGPGPMMEAARAVAENQGWPEEAVHFEYFRNSRTIDTDSSFEINLARSVMTLQVPPGKTILSVLRENGIGIPSSCEQGACGTCGVAVLEGTPDHQDVYLRRSEREACNRIMTCVSRAKSKRLVLDI